MCRGEQTKVDVHIFSWNVPSLSPRGMSSAAHSRPLPLSRHLRALYMRYAAALQTRRAHAHAYTKQLIAGLGGTLIYDVTLRYAVIGLCT